MEGFEVELFLPPWTSPSTENKGMTNRYLAYGKGPRWEMSRFRRRIDEELHQAVYKRQRWSPGERCGNAIDREWQIYSFRVRLPRLTFPSIISGWSFFSFCFSLVGNWWIWHYLGGSGKHRPDDPDKIFRKKWGGGGLCKWGVKPTKDNWVLSGFLELES